VTRVLLVLALVLACASACVGAAPCSEADAVMAAHAIECRERVRTECADVLDSECPAVKECDDWGNKRCGLGQAGAGGQGGGLP
jgi:hypothetical protein